MRLVAVAMAGLMAASVAAAQQAKSPTVVWVGPQGNVQDYVMVGAGCPGRLQARQQTTGVATVWTTAQEDESNGPAWSAKPQGLGVHVEFAGTETAVKTIELRVSYLPLGLHRMEVSPMMTNAPKSEHERTKTFNLDRVAAMRIGGNLLVGPAATITRVHLASATFADGTVWRAPSEDACSVVPNRVLLVGGK